MRELDGKDRTTVVKAEMVAFAFPEKKEEVEEHTSKLHHTFIQ
jgi:hypothetical protein